MKDIHISNKNMGIPGFSQITLTLMKVGIEKLALVKVIKNFTGFDLRESKDIMDNVILQPQLINIYLNPEELINLKKQLSEIDCIWTIDDIQKNRNKKLLELGFGTHEELVECAVENDIVNIISNNWEYQKIYNLLMDRYRNISSKELKKILKGSN